MLFSLVKIIIFFSVVVGITLGLGELLKSNGFVRLSLMDTELTISPLIAALLLFFLLLGFWILLKILGFFTAVLRFLNGDETAVSRYFNKNRERKGFEALADGLVALASGEGQVAISKAAKAEKYLKRPELTNLIIAQAADSLNDSPKAYEFYKELLKDDRTRFVGIIGIMKHKLSDGDRELALKLAEKAFSLKPKHEKTQDVLLQLQAGNEDWRGARKTLNAKLKYGLLPRDVHRRRDAVLALSEARSILADGKFIEAREASIEANRLSPDLIPAAAMAARSYIQKGKPKNALRIIKKAWEIKPHPDLTAVFKELTEKESEEERIKSFKNLSRNQSDDDETKMFLSELYIAAGNFSDARSALGALVETLPNARVMTILAAILRGEGESDEEVRDLLTQALNAPRGPQWACENCFHVHTSWVPVCRNCKSFDTLSWKELFSEEEDGPQSLLELPNSSDQYGSGDINLKLLKKNVDPGKVEIKP